MNIRYAIFICSFALFNLKNAFSQEPTNKITQKILLPNGWSLTPQGRALQLGDLPLNIQISPSGKMLAVTNNGQGTQSIQLIDPKTEKILDEKTVSRAWYGLKFSSDSKKLYVSGGNDNVILIYPITKNKLGIPDSLFLGKKFPAENISPTGIEIDAKNSLLYTVTKENQSLYVVDLKSKSIIKKVELGEAAYTCILSPDRNKLYISIWGGDKVLIYNTKTSEITNEIITESHPNEMVLTKNGKYLFVANSISNSVSVIETSENKLLENISTSLYPTKLTGSTTNGLALSKNEKKIYIANADNNCLAVFDISNPGKSSSLGFIPTGWYPTSVKTYKNKIIVSNGKGFSSLSNSGGPKGNRASDEIGEHTGGKEKKGFQYIASLFKGTLSFIDVPEDQEMKVLTKKVYENTPFNQEKLSNAFTELNNPIPKKIGEISPIKYVFYIIKENRTYDQVLGDMKEGNGDSSLCIFPEKITPNQHALARNFVLLDNFYVDAEVSADGHSWSTGAYATDYIEKNWPSDYSGRGKSSLGNIRFTKEGLIWDFCKRAGISYRNYGEQFEASKNMKALDGHMCEGYPGFNLMVKDSERVRIWKKDFDSLVSKNELPQFNIFSFPTDHTSGQQIGKFSPTAMVAGNDLAVGEFIEYLSKSSVWNQSAVFIVEDDAQSGSDHVDAHRSPAYVISPYVKRGFVDHTMYSTSGILRTIELILSLPPMSQYDAGALPLFNCFTNKIDTSIYYHKTSMVNLDEKNIAINKSSLKSKSFNFAKEDAVPDLDLNEVVWKSVKGETSEMPPPRRSAFIVLEKKVKD